MTNPGHRVLVCGGRDYFDRDRVFAVLDHYHRESPFAVLIQGAARGADRLAHMWALHANVPVLDFPADWEKHGRAAGPIRNAQMLREGKPTVVIAFPGGRGTANMVSLAKRVGVPVLEIPA